MSLPTLVIGTKNLSSWSLRPWLALKHLNIGFEEIELALDTPEYYQRIDQYSPTRRVPAFIDGGLKVWDSLAICEYANELTNGAGWPRDPQARAHARSISAEMHSGFQGLRTSWPMNAAAANLKAPLSDTASADIARIDIIWQECRSKYSASGPWLFGAFSIADAMYAPVVLRFKTYGAELFNAGLSDISRQYLTTMLADAHLQSWIANSKQARL